MPVGFKQLNAKTHGVTKVRRTIPSQLIQRVASMQQGEGVHLLDPCYHSYFAAVVDVAAS
jgi:hypothetical protein